MMSERESTEMAQHGEVLRWSTDSGEDEYPQTRVQTVEEDRPDSEEPTEFGVVWERFVIRETEDILAVPSSTTGLEITTRNKDTVGIRVSNAGSSTAVPEITMEVESPCLSEYESDGFLSRRKSLSKRSQANLGIFKRAKTLTPSKENSDDDDDAVPFSRLLKVKEVNGSDGEEDDVPLVSLLHKAKTYVVADVRTALAVPKGDACMGLHIARDFGGAHGVCKGSIVSVDLNR
jgi:hypothetical protein